MATASGNNTHATGNLYQHSAQQYPPPLQPHQNVAYGTSADDAKTAHVASGAIVPVIAQQQPVTHWSTPQPAHQHQHYHDHGEIRGLTPVETNDVKRSMFDPLAPSKQQIQSQQIPQLQQQGQTLNVHQQMPISMSGAPFTSTHFGESSVLVASGIQQQHFSGIVQQSQQPQPHPSQKALQWNPQPSPPQITDSADHDPFGIFGSENPPTKTSFTASQQPSPAPPLKEIQTSNSDIVSVVSRSSLEGSSSRIEDGSERQLQPPTTIYEQNHTNNSEDYAPPPPPSKTSTYSAQLAQTAPPNASPLPSYSAVRHSGFVLSRISFRSILLKKWKQTFWIQYGPHKLLFFRSISDYDDWLYNPYHTKTQRDFLVKFEVDFVTDLSKATIKGYQVTGVRLKAYNRKIMRQFKLERWMEYGPTIAAAFASTETLEVENLRRCIMELINASQNSLYSSASDHYDNERDLHESSGQPNQGITEHNGGISSRRRRTETEENHDGMNGVGDYLPTGLNASYKLRHAQSTPDILSEASLGTSNENYWTGRDSSSVQSATDNAAQGYERNQSAGVIEGFDARSGPNRNYRASVSSVMGRLSLQKTG